jgi:hypothetical protein
MIASRGMGAISPSKMPKGKRKARRDDTDFTEYAEGGRVGLYANIAAKRARGEKMRSAGSAGAPKKSDFVNAAKTASYAEGGKTKSTVNSAGNYTKPGLRKRIFNAVKAEATAGTGAGQWSARKAQMVAQRYKKAGGGYRD